MLSFLGRNPGIFSDGLSIDTRLSLDLPLAHAFTQQCLDCRLQIRLQNVHPSPLPFV